MKTRVFLKYFVRACSFPIYDKEMIYQQQKIYGTIAI